MFALDDQTAIRRGLEGVDAVAHCAGPFSRTALPMAAACIATGTPYLDITGEPDVFESLHALDGRAGAAGVTLLPGAGFDVVPTDCLAALLAARLPDATQLDLAFLVGGGPSPGTARTSLAGAGDGGRIRVGGEIRSVPMGSRQVRAAFPSGARTVVSVPWGDISTAYHSTGIPDVTTYTAMPPGALAASRALRIAPLRGVLAGAAARLVRGPGERRLSSTRCEVWGRARDAAGNTVSGTLTGPNPYRLTVDSVLRIMPRMGGSGTGFPDSLACAGRRLRLDPGRGDRHDGGPQVTAPAAGPVLRPARPGEAGALTALALRSKAFWGYDEAFMASCRDELTLDEDTVTARRTVVAQDAGEVIGFATLEGEPPHGSLGMLFVAPEAMRRGAGRLLYGHMLAAAGRLGFTRLSIDADPNAEAFYRAMGAVTVGRTPSGSIPGRTLPLMSAASPPGTGPPGRSPRPTAASPADHDRS